jgi:hypothetical protein
MLAPLAGDTARDQEDDMRQVLGAMWVAAGLVATGCAPSEHASQESAPLTATDVDVAPECQGIIGFANAASYTLLDAYLPSNVAQNIVSARAVSPFVTLEDLSSVSLVGEARLTQIHQAAQAESYIGADCVGIYDEVAVSADDGAAMVDLVNSVSSTELHLLLPNAWNGAVNLLNARPFTGVSQISATSGIGPVSFRGLRNAATLAKPFEELAAAATALHRDADIIPHFDWYAEAHTHGYYSLNGMTCFGIDPALLPNGTTIRAELADDAEVYAEVESTLSFADRYSELTLDPAAGLANLSDRISGGSFFGCYISYADDPWSGNNLAFFVDTETGFGVLTETRWSE